VTTRDAFTGGPFQTASLAQDLDTLIGLDNQTKQIENLYAIYGYDGDTRLAAKRAQILADRNALADVLTTIATVDVTVIPTVPQLPSLAFGNPVLTCTTPTVLDWLGQPPAGQGSAPDIGYVDILMGTTVTAISFNGVWNQQNAFAPQAGIKTVTYTRADGTSWSVAEHDSSGDDLPLTYWSDGDSIVLQPGDRITGLSGAVTGNQYQPVPFASYAIAITLTTGGPGGNRQAGWVSPWDLWPPDWTTGVKTITVPADQVAVGFQVWENQIIGLLTTKFSRARWVRSPVRENET
jgi:hypothetical protein